MRKARILRLLRLGSLFVLASACLPGASISLGATQTPFVITATPINKPTTETPPNPTQTPDSAGNQPAVDEGGLERVNIYLVAVGDNGASGKAIGCGDSLVAVEVPIPATQGVLRAALNELLALEGQPYYGQSGLYNALYLSHLRIENVSVVDGEALIELKGELVTGGECDIPRIEEQLRATALQFATVQRVSVFVNGIPLQEVLDLRG